MGLSHRAAYLTICSFHACMLVRGVKVHLGFEIDHVDRGLGGDKEALPVPAESDAADASLEGAQSGWEFDSI